MQQERDDSLEQAIKDELGPGKTYKDGPWNRAVRIDDNEAMRKAIEDGRNIDARQKELLEDKKLKRPPIEKPEPVKG